MMELVEGEDLSLRIARGGRCSSDALAIARQLADALEAAHESRRHPPRSQARQHQSPARWHRQSPRLRPGEGDRRSRTARAASRPPSSPTVTSPALTAMGLILGTAAYMSPEQARETGRQALRYLGVWRGVYEMLTGRRLFDADNITETLAAVLTRDLTITALPTEIPAGLRALVADCLVRDPKKRLRDIGDARLRLEKLDSFEAGGIEPAAADSAGSRGIRRWLWPGVAVLATLGALVAAGLYVSRPVPEIADVVTFEIAAQAAALTSLSPDGRHVAYGSPQSDGGSSRLWVRSLSALESRVVPGTDGVTIRGLRFAPAIAWSPDSRSVAFARAIGVYRVDVVSGQTTELVKIPQTVMAPGAWSSGGVVLFARRGQIEAGAAGVWRVADTGGSPVQVTELRQGEAWHRPACFLPDGRRFLYVVYRSFSGDDGGEIRIGSVDRRPAEQDVTPLLSADGPAVYAPALDRLGAPSATGYLLYVRRGGLMAQAFDPGGRRSATGCRCRSSPASRHSSTRRPTAESCIAP